MFGIVRDTGKEFPKRRKMSAKIFVILPAKDLKRSMDFFKSLGFTFNPQFTVKNGQVGYC